MFTKQTYAFGSIFIKQFIRKNMERMDVKAEKSVDSIRWLLENVRKIY